MNHRLVNRLRVTLLTLGLLGAFAAAAAEHCVVLQYHHVSEQTPGITSVTPEQFQQHLDYLKQNDFQVLDLNRVVEHLRERKPLPDRCVALTIDDAYRSVYEEAWPRAQKYGYALTVFVSTEHVDEGLRNYLTWDQMREMAGHGVTFENHSHTHDHLVRLADDESFDDWEQRVASDLLTAQNRLQQELGRAPTLFAYPYGEFNLALQRLIASIGLTGFGQQSGPAWADGNMTALPRFPMNVLYARMRTFPTKVSTLPLPIVSAQPMEPLVEDHVWQPSLTLTFKPGVENAQRLTCFVNGSPDVEYHWLQDDPLQVEIVPKGLLQVGRNRYNCTLPATEGRFHWYSHFWIRRQADGSWYRESVSH